MANNIRMIFDEAESGKICMSCKWYAEYEGTCCNGMSEFCADWPPYPEDEGCECWERKE